MRGRGVALLLLLVWCGTTSAAEDPRGAGYPITPVPFTDVTVRDVLWSQRLEVNRTVSIPYAFRQCEQTGRIRNFEVADSVLSGLLRSGRFCSQYGFDDSDVFKIIEGASYALQTLYDRRLDAYLDSLIEKIGRAQEPDGYLYTMRTIDPAESWAKERWVNARTQGSHELYNLGHLYEAAVAHYLATGKHSLLNIAVRSANLLVATMGPDAMRTTPGHQVTEIGLAKLSLETGDGRYLKLAKFFLDERGNGETYNQDHLPVIEQTEAVGHAVRAGYLYAGMADIAALTGDRRYADAIDRIWEDVITGKLYLTGGIGSAGNIEGFGPRFDLPNLSAYCETCAAIANTFWNYRMFLLHGDGKYMDLVERIIYNGFLAGVSMSGDRFFYPNPLESIAGADRSPWFACACCPSNVVRFVPSIPGYVYARRGEDLYVNLFLGGTGTVRMPGRIVRISQQSRYPWDGTVTLTIEPDVPGEFTLKIRIPGWARGVPVPGELYRYDDDRSGAITMTVNGNAETLVMERGYASVRKRWARGDRVVLTLPMEVRRVTAHPEIADDRGKVAFERGPMVFCLEGADNPGGKVLHLVVPDTAEITSGFRPDLLGGVQVLEGTAFPTRRTLTGDVQTGEQQRFMAIPYYAWAHRGRFPMAVWVARTPAVARPLPAPTLACLSTLHTSGGKGHEALADQLLPASSHDRSVPYFHWWPKKGSQEWLQFEFPGVRTVSSTSVYWYDDTGTGECRLPAAWRILYRSGEIWKPVENESGHTIASDRLTTVSFTPVTTSALRLDIELPEGYSSGLYEWVIE